MTALPAAWRLAAALVCGALIACASSSPQQREDARASRQPQAPPPAPDVHGPLLTVDGRVPAEPDVEARLQGARELVEREMRQVVGRSARKLARGKPEGALGNLVTDIMRAHASEATGQPVHMAWTNLGGLRADLPAGEITVGSVLEVMPFDNAIVVFELTGADVLRILQRSASHGGDPVSGISYRIQGKQPLDVIIDGAPLDPARTYRLCTNDYIMDGGGKYEAVAKARNVNRTGILIRDAVLTHFRREAAAGRTVDAQVGGRILVKGGRS